MKILSRNTNTACGTRTAGRALNRFCEDHRGWSGETTIADNLKKLFEDDKPELNKLLEDFAMVWNKADGGMFEPNTMSVSTVND
jgi:hypothetical protein